MRLKKVSFNMDFGILSGATGAPLNYEIVSCSGPVILAGDDDATTMFGHNKRYEINLNKIGHCD